LEQFAMRGKLGWKLVDLGFEKVIRYTVTEGIEPEVGQLIEDSALARNGRTEDVVVSRNPIAGDQEQRLTEIVDVSHLATTRRGESLDDAFSNS